MKRIDWLIIRSFVGPFIMSFAIILFILVMQFMSLYMNEILGKGLGPIVLVKLMGYASGRLAITAMPVAILAAALMTFGSMGEHYELASLKSCGISLFKIMRSMIATGLILTSISLWLSFYLVPKANLKFFSLLYDVQRKKADLAIIPGHFYWDIDGYVIRVSDKNKEKGVLYDVLIYDHTENRGNSDVIMADSALTFTEGNSLRMVLYHGVRHEDYKPQAGRKNYPHGRTYFDSLYYKFSLEGFELDRTDESQFRHQITLSQPQLSDAIDSLGVNEKEYDRKANKQLSRYTKIDSAFAVALPDTFPVTKPVMVVDMEPDEEILLCYSFKDEPIELLNRAMTNIRAVKSYVDFMVKKKDDQYKSRNKYEYEYYLRFALSVNCILFIMIGVSLGAIIRKGGLGMPALVSIISFLLFYILTTYGKKFAKEGVMDPWIGAWLSVLVFAPIALAVTYMAAMDSGLMSSTAWRTTFNKIISSLRKRLPAKKTQA